MWIHTSGSSRLSKPVVQHNREATERRSMRPATRQDRPITPAPQYLGSQQLDSLEDYYRLERPKPCKVPLHAGLTDGPCPPRDDSATRLAIWGETLVQ